MDVRIEDALSYDTESGKLYWRKDRPRDTFLNEMTYKCYMTRNAGDEAGCVSRNAYGGEYIMVRLNKVLYTGHKLAWYFLYGEFPTSEIDHADGNGLNNRPDNLLLCDGNMVINARNQKRRSTNTSGHNGVSHSRNGKWRAYGVEEGRWKSLGTYQTKTEAVQARKVWETAQGNFSQRHGN